jgi:formylglycine-generating enzyme required for sulfatase activity
MVKIAAALALIGLGLAMCAHRQADRGNGWKAGTTFRDCADGGCPEMVRIAGGGFLMGVPPGEEQRAGAPESSRDEAAPQHHVSVPAFAMGKYHVTRGEFAAFIRDSGYAMPPGCYVMEKNAPSNGNFDKGEDVDHWGMVLEQDRSWQDPGYPQTDRDPVVCVSWNDIQAYARWLSKKTGHTYRLPSEAEWEYAARAGTTTTWFWGDDPAEACEYANVSDLTLLAHFGVAPNSTNHFPCADGFVFTAPEGSFKPNPFGLYDMQGNAWEWTADCWNEKTGNYEGAPVDGSAWVMTDCRRHVERGGSFGFNAWNVRSGFRIRNFPVSHASTIGFRIARTR